MEVHYVRELSVVEHELGKPEHNPDRDRTVDPDYLDELIAASAASLNGLRGYRPVRPR